MPESWLPRPDSQPHLQTYLIQTAQKYGLYRHIRFNSNVEEARWDDEEMQWKLNVRISGEKDGQFSPGYVLSAGFLVSAVGQLNMPREPNIPGIRDFQGKIMHSARWDWTYDLKDKKVAVIGNGKPIPRRNAFLSSELSLELFRWLSY